jgi:hypothetical protein
VTPKERARTILDEWVQYKTLAPKDSFEAVIEIGIFKEHLNYWFQELEIMLIDDVDDEKIRLWLENFDVFYGRFRDNLLMSVLKHGTTNRH